MPFWSHLFRARPGDAPAPAAGEDYKGFRITPDPIREGGQYRIAARIEKTIDGELRRHRLIRADTMASLDEATAISAAKARQMIDERGEGLFG
jgi:hypothetical protein